MNQLKFRVRRGPAADLPTLMEGEWGMTTDTHEVYMGTSSGNLRVGTTADVALLTQAIADTQAAAADATTKVNNHAAAAPAHDVAQITNAVATTDARLANARLPLPHMHSNNIGYDLTATFARASVAYKLDGTQVASGAPRFEANGVRVEEGTTNLIPANKANFAGWNAYSGATVTLTQGQTVSEWGATDATRVQSSGGTNFLKYYINIVAPGVNGVSYTGSLWVKNNGSAVATFGIGYATVFVNPGDSKRISLSAVGNGSTNFNIELRTQNVADSLDLVCWRPMGETKAFATSWIPEGQTRAAEALTIPENVFSPQGTIEFDYTPPVPVTSGTYIFATKTSTGTTKLESYLSASRYAVRYGNGATTTDVISSNVFVAGVKVRLGICYGASGVKIYVNGSSVGADATAPTLDFTNGANLGSGYAGTAQSNAQYSNLRISNVARTDAEMQANSIPGQPLSWDASTTFYNPFTAYLDTVPRIGGNKVWSDAIGMKPVVASIVFGG